MNIKAKLASKLRVPSLTEVLSRELSKIVYEFQSSKQEQMPNALVFFDIGVGTGSYWPSIADKLCAKFPEVSFELHTLDSHIDFSEYLLSMSSSRFKILQHQVDFENPLALGQFIEYPDYGGLVICCFDVLEHLSKEAGWRLLYSLDEAMSNAYFARSLVAVPNGFVYQPGSIDNVHNAHISAWQPSEMKRAGYKPVAGLTSTKFQKLRKLSGHSIWLLRALAEGAVVGLIRFPIFGYEVLFTKSNKGLVRHSFSPEGNKPAA